ncbi:COX assembly mitochondrial protein like protein [Ditylenchus destructor]|nr:COX assembly mitochondrial protein like protein [Ditylenchus destructor]
MSMKKASDSDLLDDPRDNQLLKTDDLKDLKEGQIFVDEDGKHYQVKKSVLHQGMIGGPHGLGDPEDRTLRKVEANVLIPDLMNKHQEALECKETFEEFKQCMIRENRRNEFLAFQRCKPTQSVYHKCKLQTFQDPEFRQKVTDEYLKDRSEYRRTGLSAKQREMERFREWKKSQQEQNSGST